MFSENAKLIVLIVFILFFVFFVFLIRIRIKIIGMLRKGPPLKIRLFPEEMGKFKDPEGVKRLADDFKRLGFEEVGVHGVKEMPGTLMLAMMNASEDLSAYIYEHPSVGLFCEVIARYEDGGSVSSGNSPHGGTLDWPEDMKSLHEKGATPERLVELVEDNLHGGRLKRVSSGTSVSEYEEGYAKIMAWRLARGGATKEEIRRIAASMGKARIGESTIEATAKIEGLKAAMQLSRQCLENFIKQGGLPLVEGSADRLVVIHDKLGAEGALAYLGGGSVAAGRRLATDVELESLAARDLFRRINEKLPEDKRFKYIGRVGEPIEADLYMRG